MVDMSSNLLEWKSITIRTIISNIHPSTTAIYKNLRSINLWNLKIFSTLQRTYTQKGWLQWVKRSDLFSTEINCRRKSVIKDPNKFSNMQVLALKRVIPVTTSSRFGGDTRRFMSDEHRVMKKSIWRKSMKLNNDTKLITINIWPFTQYYQILSRKPTWWYISRSQLKNNAPKNFCNSIN